MRPEKGLEIHLEIATKLSNYPIQFHIAGSGELQVKLEKIIKDRGLNVILEGYVPDVSKFFAQSDLYLQTSISEGSPNSVLEAMAYGMPVIASDIPSSREILGSDDMLFNLNDIDSAVDLILKVYADSEYRAKLSAMNLERVNTSFNQVEVFNRMLECMLTSEEPC